MNAIELIWESVEGISKATVKSGVYMINDDQYAHGSDQLVYIGMAKDISNRLFGHEEWLNRGRNITIRTAECDKGFCDDVESLLIFVHQPSYNNKKGESLNLKCKNDILIYNYGDYGKLLPIIDSQYRWYNKSWN